MLCCITQLLTNQYIYNNAIPQKTIHNKAAGIFYGVCDMNRLDKTSVDGFCDILTAAGNMLCWQ